VSGAARKIVRPPGLPEPPGWSHAVTAGGWVFGGAQMAADFATGLDPLATPAAPFLTEPLDVQGRVVLSNTAAVLEAAGCDVRRDLIRVWQWMPASYPSDDDYRASRAHWPAFRSGTPYARLLGEMVGDAKRASTGIGVRQLSVPGAALSLDFIAIQPDPTKEKVAVQAPEGVPQPKIGYSPATRYGDWVFLAGFGATDFQGDWGRPLGMGEPSLIAPEARVNPYIWLGSEIEAQTEFTLSAMAKIAEAAGSSLARCVKADVTLTHPDDFAGMDRVWRRLFPDDPPARNVVTGAQLVIKGLRVEIALVLLADDATLPRRAVHADEAPPALGHAPQAMRAGDFVFVSALLPVEADGAVAASHRFDPALPYFHDPARRQAQLLLERMDVICRAAGGGVQDVCKVQAFLDDLSHLPAVLDAWRAAFPCDPPALSAVAMGGGHPLLAPGAHVQFDAIAYIPGSHE